MIFKNGDAVITNSFFGGGIVIGVLTGYILVRDFSSGSIYLVPEEKAVKLVPFAQT